MSLRRRLIHALDHHGLPGLLRRALTRTPTHQTRTPETPAQPHPFDLLHGTETSGYIPGQLLASGRPADFHNTAYYAISPSTLTAALALLPEPLETFTFVDLGCGKGPRPLHRRCISLRRPPRRGAFPRTLPRGPSQHGKPSPASQASH